MPPTAPALFALLARFDARGEAHIISTARRLREVGLMTRGPRGVAALPVTSIDAAALLIALATGEGPVRAAEATVRASQLELRPGSNVDRAPDCLEDVFEASILLEAVAMLIDHAEELVYVAAGIAQLDRQDQELTAADAIGMAKEGLLWNVRLVLSRPGPTALLELVDHIDGPSRRDASCYFMPTKGSQPAGPRPEIERGLSYRGILELPVLVAVAELLSGTSITQMPAPLTAEDLAAWSAKGGAHG
jgi:hypothetical protein